MLRSQWAAALARHLGDWNAFWGNCFLDYTSSLRRICVVLRRRKNSFCSVKLADSAHALLAAASSDSPYPHQPPPVAWPKFRFGPKISNAVQVRVDFGLEMTPGSNGKSQQDIILLSKFWFCKGIWNMGFEVKLANSSLETLLDFVLT